MAYLWRKLPHVVVIKYILIIYIKFKDVHYQRKSEAYSHFLYNIVQQTLNCNLFSVIQKEVDQALKVLSTINHLKLSTSQ